jgi:hypothetical protein
VPLPAAVAVPTVVPPLVQVDGADASGPNTVNVIVPFALVAPELPASRPVIAAFEIAVPTLPVAGAVTDSVGDAFPMTVSAIPGPQVLVAALLLSSDG